MFVQYIVSRSRARRDAFVGVALTAIVSLAACNSDTAPAATAEVDGTPVSVGNGSAYTYVINGSAGASSIGIAMTPSALQGLPSSDAMWDLPLPDGVAAAPFDHATLNWNAQGHPPGMYMLPHFDFHFYTISSSAQSAIQGGPDTTTVSHAYMPPDYVSGIESVPDMGVHWVDTTAAEFHGQTFTSTFIYGFYRGGLVFVEPMVTRALLTSQPNVTSPVKQPQAFAESGRYPTMYGVHVDPTTNTIRVSLDSLVAR